MGDRFMSKQSVVKHTRISYEWVIVNQPIRFTLDEWVSTTTPLYGKSKFTFLVDKEQQQESYQNCSKKVMKITIHHIIRIHSARHQLVNRFSALRLD
jgi:hypothetical protein